MTGEKEKTVEQLEENYKGLEKIIFTFTELPELFGPQLLEMMKLAGQVRRPFHGRSVVLVYMWYHLALCDAVKEERLPINRRAITTNLKQSIEFLTLASTKLPEAATFKDASVVQELTAKFTSKSAEMQKLYGQYKLDDKWTTLIKVQLEKATKEDKDHYAQTEARLKAPAPVKTG